MSKNDQSNPLVQAFTDARGWADRAHAAEMIDAHTVARFKAAESAVPADLFRNTASRPLVAGLFGGTGVGKSSLLNRLAGEEVARTGVERPTSREVTLYVPDTVALADLPPSLPLDRLEVRRHSNPRWRDVLWLDAPDIDSVEQANREAALAWLPHVDLLLYVVSPERYRDDAGWRVLASRGGRHAWMFVMNRCDESDPAQRADFLSMLAEAGFKQPMVFATSCAASESARENAGDQLADLESAIGELLREHGVAEFQKLGEQARLDSLADLLRDASAAVGKKDSWDMLHKRWLKEWTACAADLREGLDWPIRAVSERFAVRSYDMKTRLLSRAAKAAASSGGAVGEALVSGVGEGSSGDDQPEQDLTPGRDAGANIVEPLWDAWAEQRLETAVDQVELAARRAGLPAEAIRSALEQSAALAATIVRGRAQETLRGALAKPGNLLRRAARRVTRLLSGLLPAAALGWIGYTVVRGYNDAASGATEYLSSNFAVHSVLLVGVAWGFPYALDRMLRPAMEEVAAKALRRGLAEGIEDLGVGLGAAFEETQVLAAELVESAGTLALRIDPGASGGSRKGSLARVVAGG